MATPETAKEAYIAPTISSTKLLTAEDLTNILAQKDASLFGALRMGLTTEEVGKIGQVIVDKSSFTQVSAFDRVKNKPLNYITAQVELQYLGNEDKKPYTFKIQSPSELRLLSEEGDVFFKIGTWSMTNSEGKAIPKLIIQDVPFVVDENQNTLEGNKPA